MAKPEWGIKRICPNCGARYYDLRKDPPTCPACGTVFDPEALLRSRRSRPAPVEEVKKVPVRTDDEEAAPAEAEDEEETAEEEVEDTEETADEIEEDVEATEVEDTETVDEDIAADGEDEDVLLEDAEELGDEGGMEEVVDVEGEEDR